MLVNRVSYLSVCIDLFSQAEQERNYSFIQTALMLLPLSQPVEACRLSLAFPFLEIHETDNSME